MLGKDLPGALGSVGGGVLFEAIHADWPAYPGDRSWALALLRLGDFPIGTEFRCISVIDQVALLVAEVGIREQDLFSESHMHVAVRIEELLELDEMGLVTGVELDLSLSPAQILMKRNLGTELWEDIRAGRATLSRYVDGESLPVPLTDDEEPSDDLEDFEIFPARRSPERVAMYEGTTISLTEVSKPEIERVAQFNLEIPSTLQPRLTKLIDAGLYDSAIRDAGAALEMRMREFAQTEAFGQALVERYIKALLAAGGYYPARLKSLRQELRSIFRFIRNEFAHNLQDLEPSRGLALLSRVCWHVADVEGCLAEEKNGASSGAAPGTSVQRE